MSLHSSSCRFSDHEIVSKLTQKCALGVFVNNLVFHYKHIESAMSYTFVSDDFLLKMNLEHLQHDTYTDIITFDLSEKNASYILADIYISVDRVKENAKMQSLSYKEELLRVIIHGALHISGFGDKSNKEKTIMRALEEEWLNKYLSNS